MGKQTTDKNHKNPTLRSLTPQICGINKWTKRDLKNGRDGDRMERDFDAAYQESKRIRNKLAKFANMKSTPKITNKNSAAVAELLKTMHFTGELRDVYEKIRSDDKLQKNDYKRVLITASSVLISSRPDLPDKHRQQVELQLKIAGIQGLLDEISSQVSHEDFTDRPDIMSLLNLFDQIHFLINSAFPDHNISEKLPIQTHEKEDPLKKSLSLIFSENLPSRDKTQNTKTET